MQYNTIFVQQRSAVADAKEQKKSQSMPLPATLCARVHTMQCAEGISRPHAQCMWHSQILGSFEATNTTCVVLHENLNLAIEITKDVFPDDKKCKKGQKSGLKRLF